MMWVCCQSNWAIGASQFTWFVSLSITFNCLSVEGGTLLVKKKQLSVLKTIWWVFEGNSTHVSSPGDFIKLWNSEDQQSEQTRYQAPLEMETSFRKVHYWSGNVCLAILDHKAARTQAWGSSLKQSWHCGRGAELWVEDFSSLKWRRRSCRWSPATLGSSREMKQKKAFKDHQQECDTNFCLSTHQHIPEAKGNVWTKW